MPLTEVWWLNSTSTSSGTSLINCASTLCFLFSKSVASCNSLRLFEMRFRIFSISPGWTCLGNEKRSKARRYTYPKADERLTEIVCFSYLALDSGTAPMPLLHCRKFHSRLKTGKPLVARMLIRGNKRLSCVLCLEDEPNFAQLVAALMGH